MTLWQTSAMRWKICYCSEYLHRVTEHIETTTRWISEEEKLKEQKNNVKRIEEMRLNLNLYFQRVKL